MCELGEIGTIRGLDRNLHVTRKTAMAKFTERQNPHSNVAKDATLEWGTLGRSPWDVYPEAVFYP